MDKSFACLRWALIEVNYVQGFKHDVPPEKKRIFIYNTTHHPTDIARCERECVCVCGEKGWEGEKRDCPLLEPIKSQNCKIPPVHKLRKKKT